MVLTLSCFYEIGFASFRTMVHDSFRGNLCQKIDFQSEFVILGVRISNKIHRDSTTAYRL